MAGEQQVKWGMDRDGDGRIDDRDDDDIKVDWSQDGKAGSERSYSWKYQDALSEPMTTTVG